MNEFSIPIRVYLEDTDAGGIVYYVNYLKFMERARTELLRSLGFEFNQLSADNLQFVVHSVSAQYRKPARMDDELLVTAVVQQLARTYVVFQQQVRRGEEILCDAQVKVACVDTAHLKPALLPVPVKNQFLLARLNGPDHAEGDN